MGYSPQDLQVRSVATAASHPGHELGEKGAFSVQPGRRIHGFTTDVAQHNNGLSASSSAASALSCTRLSWVADLRDFVLIIPYRQGKYLTRQRVYVIFSVLAP